MPGPSQLGLEKPIQYAISILHRRTGFGKRVRFRSTFYASERRDARFIEQIFRKAFHKAHPSWKIEEVTVEPTSPQSSQKEENEIGAIVAEKPVVVKS